MVRAIHQSINCLTVQWIIGICFKKRISVGFLNGHIGSIMLNKKNSLNIYKKIYLLYYAHFYKKLIKMDSFFKLFNKQSKDVKPNTVEEKNVPE